MIQDCQAERLELMLKPTLRVNQPCAQGIEEANLRTLFDAEESSLLRYAFSLTGRREVAEEIVQEVFLQLHVHWNNVESPREWLFRSVRNRAYNYFRDNRRVVLNADGDSNPSANTQDVTPDAAFQRMEAIGTLREIVGELDEADQQLVKLKYFEGLKYREISEQTGLSVSNVGYRLHHILKGLAGKLRRLGIDEDS